MPHNHRVLLPTGAALAMLIFLAGATGCASTPPTGEPQDAQEQDVDMVVANKRAPCPKMTKLICSKRTGRPQKCRCASEDDLELLIRRF